MYGIVPDIPNEERDKRPHYDKANWIYNNSPTRNLAKHVEVVDPERGCQ